MYDVHDDGFDEALISGSAYAPVATQNGAPKKAGAPADGFPGGSGGGWTGGSIAGVSVGTILGVCAILGAVGFGMAIWSLNNDDDLRDTVKHVVQPVLALVYNFTTSASLTSQTYCTGAFTHVAYGDPATGNITLDKRRTLKREVTGEQTVDSYSRDAPQTRREHPETSRFSVRGFPVADTVLPGVSGVVSILRADTTVQITFAATGLPNDLADPTPIWEYPDVVRMLASYIRYECIPPIAQWPNCNDTIDNVATCEILSDDFDHPVFFGPFGRASIGNIHHTQITNGAAWWLDRDAIAVIGGYVANAYAEAGTDSETDAGDYLVGVQSYIVAIDDTPLDTDPDTDLYFDQIHASFVYQTDAAIDWEVPDSCRADCL
jgi:hypothetical protein